jgi:hypothetical protein
MNDQHDNEQTDRAALARSTYTGPVCALRGCTQDGQRSFAQTKEQDFICSECIWALAEPALKASRWRGTPGTKLGSPSTIILGRG